MTGREHGDGPTDVESLVPMDLSEEPEGYEADEDEQDADEDAPEADLTGDPIGDDGE